LFVLCIFFSRRNSVVIIIIFTLIAMVFKRIYTSSFLLQYSVFILLVIVGDLFTFKGDVGSTESECCTWWNRATQWWGICCGYRNDDASDKGGMWRQYSMSCMSGAGRLLRQRS
jgi:hypothetical protein